MDFPNQRLLRDSHSSFSKMTTMEIKIGKSLCIFMLIAMVAGLEAKKHHNGTSGKSKTCGYNYTTETGIVRVNNGSSSTVDPGEDCTWQIYYLNNNKTDENKTIFLVFDELYLNEAEDQLRITADGKDLPSFGPFKLSSDPGVISYLTGKSNISVHLKTGKDEAKPIRKFQFHFYSNAECKHSFSNQESGIFSSPLYEKDHPMPINCAFNVTVMDKTANWLSLWFERFTFNKGEIDIKGSEVYDGKYSASNFPAVEFLAQDVLEIDLTIDTNSSDPREIFMANFNSVNKDCSGTYKLNSGSPSQLLVSPKAATIQSYLASNKMALTCQWLLECDPGMKISVTIKNATLPSAMDQLLILDGPNRSSQVLLDLNAGTKLDSPVRAIFSTGNQLWISASTLFLSKDFNIAIDTVQKKDGGHMHKEGNVEVNGVDTSTFLLEVDAGQQVKFMVKDPTKLDVGSSVEFYSDFSSSSKPFAVITQPPTPRSQVQTVVSPTEKMAVVTKSFVKSMLSGSFQGVNPGCFKMATGSGDTFSLTGQCNTTCGWTIPPNKADPSAMLAFHFTALDLSPQDEVIIRKMNADQTEVANLTSTKTTIPDLWLPAVDGAFLQVTRGLCNENSTALTASYQATPECTATLTPKPGEIVHLSSPNYPNHYPLGAQCVWTVVRPNGSVFLHLNLKEVQLASAQHSLNIYSLQGTNKTLLLSFNGSSQKLPDYDLPLRTDLVVNFSSSQTSPPWNSLPGFKLDVAVVEFGETFLNKTNGTVATPGFPAPVSNGSLFAWIVQVNSIVAVNQSIIQFNLSSQSNQTSIRENLKVFDGASLNSPMIENFTDGSILSRTNSLIFLYQRTNLTVPGPAFSLNFTMHLCNMTMICGNHVCMHDEWHCNGVNDCGDYSDESHCDGTPPTPTPQPGPPPTPEPASVKGASAGVLAGGIIASLVVGAVLGVIVPIGYRRIRANRLQSYTSLNG